MDAFAQNALGMFGYMTEAHTVVVDASLAPEGRIIEARGECATRTIGNEQICSRHDCPLLVERDMLGDGVISFFE